MTVEPEPDDLAEAFVTLLTSAQDSLYRYVLSLTAGQHNRARDILQEANLVIWRKAGEFRMGTNFETWARRIVHFCVLADVRDAKRKPVLFSEELLTMLAAEYDGHAEGVAERQQRLDECLSRLPSAHRAVIRHRYVEGMAVNKIARQLHKSENSVSALLYRIRLALLDCVARGAV